jgi:aryl-alcohol dehydrogenase-like predicted oxidoreductase
MKTRELGKSDIRVTEAGLGCGGHSRIGQSAGKSAQDSADIVKRALAAGINLVDTAEAYRTEDMVGMAIKGTPRDQVVLSTKGSIRVDGRLKDAAEMEQSLDASLARLGTDHVDIYHLHGVSPDDYTYCRQELAPAMAKWKRAGKIRLAGITEAFANDTGHRMLQRAVRDDCWDVMMVGFNFLNQSARSRVLQAAMDKGIGILDMFAVRRALITPERLAGYLERLFASARPIRPGSTKPVRSPS